MSRRFVRTEFFLGIIVMAIGLSVLIGWEFDVSSLKTVFPGYISMKANTAVGLLAFGIALVALLLGVGEHRSRALWVAYGFTVLASAIGLLTLIQYVSHVDFGIDELLFEDPDAAGGTYPPGRLAPVTAISFVVTGVATYLSFGKKAKAHRTAQFLYLMVGLIAFQAIVSYVLGIETTFGMAKHTRIAVHTAAAFILLSLGFLGLTREHGLLRVVMSDSAVGASTRRLILAALFVPPLVNFLEQLGRGEGYYDADFGTLLRVISSVVFFLVMVLRSAERVDRSENDRRAALDAVLAKEKERARLVADRELAQERERAEAALRDELITAKRRAEYASAEKADLLARMSHELRTPLGGIVGLTTILTRGTATPEQQRKHAETIQASAKNLLTIINDILDMSKIEAGRVELENVPFNLRGVVQNQIDLLSSQIKDKGLQLNVQIDPALPASLRGDPIRIAQILINFMGNAIKFTDNGSIDVWVSKFATDAKGRAGIRMSVRDTGVGIPKETQDKLFQAFVQGESSTTRKFGGTGLGLSICYHLVTMMAGKIGVESEEGQGSTFWCEFELDVAETVTRLAPREQLSKARSEIAMKLWQNACVLLAEDNPINRFVITDHLHALGLEVEHAATGKRALELYRSGRYDLVMMDVQMPEMDGYEATARIRAFERTSGRHTPIIAITASAVTEELERSLAAGMDDYLTKPFETEDLVEILRKWIPASQGTPFKKVDA